MNSICLLFLVIGIFGKPARIHIRPLPAEEIIPAIIEPVVLLPPTTIQELKPEQVEQQEKQDTAQVVVVTPDSPDIHFSVPTIGNLIAPASLSTAPPLNPSAAVTQSVIRKQVMALENTGLGGERPRPPYPPLALEHGLQGTVVLLLNVDAAGSITTINLKESSGFPLLDRGTLEFVKHRWTVPPGAGTRIYEATITYRIETN